MKKFFIQGFWIILFVIILNLIAGVIFSVALPTADHRALGQLMFFPTLVIAMLITIIGSRTGKLPGTKKPSSESN